MLLKQKPPEKDYCSKNINPTIPEPRRGSIEIKSFIHQSKIINHQLPLSAAERYNISSSNRKKNIKAPEERNITMCTVIPESCHPGPDPGSPVSSRSPVIPESCHPGVLSSRNLVIPESCHPGILSSRSPVIPESCHPGPDPGSSVSFVKKVIVLYVKPPCRLMQLMQA